MGRSLVFATSPSVANLGNPSLRYELVETFAMRVATKDGSGLMERSEKSGNDPIFGDGISPA